MPMMASCLCDHGCVLSAPLKASRQPARCSPVVVIVVYTDKPAPSASLLSAKLPAATRTERAEGMKNKTAQRITVIGLSLWTRLFWQTPAGP